MIKKDEVFKIGIFNKPHGVKGEISFTFTDDIFDRVECEYLVCLLDGIFVPFFIEEYRFRSDTTALVKLEGVDTSEKARMFTNVEVYFPKKYVGEEEDSDDIPTWNYFIGFKVEDVNHGELGEIVAVDDSTMNVLFAIEKDGEELLLPGTFHQRIRTKNGQRVDRLDCISFYFPAKYILNVHDIHILPRHHLL